MVTCDYGGSNGNRNRLWKLALAELAEEIGKEIEVIHYPPGTSKYNKVEHRLFCYISKHWQGKPLVNIQTVVNLIQSTTTKNGLSVACMLDQNVYETGIKVSDESSRLRSVTLGFVPALFSIHTPTQGVTQVSY